MFKLTINTNNSAFCDDNGEENQSAAAHEVARLLRIVAGQLELDHAKRNIFDLNGNNVGRFELVP